MRTIFWQNYNTQHASNVMEKPIYVIEMVTGTGKAGPNNSFSFLFLARPNNSIPIVKNLFSSHIACILNYNDDQDDDGSEEPMLRVLEARCG